MRLLETPRGRVLLFGLLYASEGAPIGFIWWSLPTLMRERGGEVGRITAILAVVAAIWMLKFLWAPVVDVLRGPRWGFRSWILAAQILMGFTLLPLAWLDPVDDLLVVLVLLVAHALCATIQDVAIDALAINIVPRGELGRVNGFMAAGKYVGRGLFGGVALIVAAGLGWRWIILSMVGCIWAIALPVWLLPEAVGLPTSSVNAVGMGQRLKRFFESVSHFLSERVTWLAIGFALLAGAGFESIGALTGVYLPDRNVATEDVGWFRAFAVLGAMIVGAVWGGRLTDRHGPLGASIIFLLGIAGCGAVLSFADVQEAPVPWLLALVAFMYFCCGLFISASYALFMLVTGHRVAATQFSVFMAATNGCEVWSGWAGGQLVERVGYAATFLLMSAISLLALPFLILIRGHLRRTETFEPAAPE